jgi:hypothetical protein
VYARHLGTGEIVNVDGDAVMYTESAIKTAILLQYTHLVASGARDRETRVTLTGDDVAPGSGVLRYLAAGLQPTLERLGVAHDPRVRHRRQYTDHLPRRVPHMSGALDWGIQMPLRVFNKPGGGFLTCTDAGLFETDHASWIVAAMAAEQPDFASRADDSAPTAFATIGEVLYNAWSGL